METAVCVSGFLLLIFITGVHLSPDPELIFEHEGGDALFNTWSQRVYDDYVLYRVREDGDLLLINCSQPESPQQDSYDVKCDNYFYLYFTMYNLSLSQSGDYRAEGWRGGNITEHNIFHLIVCAEGDKELHTEVFISDLGLQHVTPHLTPAVEINRLYVAHGDSAILCSLNSTLGHGSSLQLYRRKWKLTKGYEHRPIDMLVLDTSTSLEPLMEDLRGRLQVDVNTSQVTLSGVTTDDKFFCTVWRGAQCQSYRVKNLRIVPNLVFANVEENVTLPCLLKGERPSQVHWTIFISSGFFTINQTHQQEVIYMLNGSLNGNNSLIIPSVPLQHSGLYRCFLRESTEEVLFSLFVCMKFSLLDVVFSHGESHLLDTTEHINESMRVYGIQWYRQKVFQPQVLIKDFNNEFKTKPVPLPEDLRGRVTVINLHSNYSMIISNLTAEDSGLYTWRVYGLVQGELGNQTMFCSEGTTRLVYRDPFGVHSPFYRAYAPLIGCVLLGLVAAVIWFKLRSRGGEQTSGRQSREGQQSGDEDLYDEVEMVELNT